MPVMPFEGLHTDALEDVYALPYTTAADENPVPAEDEAYYCEAILSGTHDEGEQDHGDWAEDTYDPDAWQAAQDRYDRLVYGD